MLTGRIHFFFVSGHMVLENRPSEYSPHSLLDGNIDEVLCFLAFVVCGKVRCVYDLRYWFASVASVSCIAVLYYAALLKSCFYQFSSIVVRRVQYFSVQGEIKMHALAMCSPAACTKEGNC